MKKCLTVLLRYRLVSFWVALLLALALVLCSCPPALQDTALTVVFTALYVLWGVLGYVRPITSDSIGFAFSLCGGGHRRRAEIVVPLLRDYGKLKCFASGRNDREVSPRSDPLIDIETTGVTWVFHDKDVSLTKSLFRWKNLLLFYDVPRLMTELYRERYKVVFVDLDAVMTWAIRLNNILTLLVPFLGFQRVKSVAFGHHACFKNMRIPAPPGTSWLKRWFIRGLFLMVMPYGRYCGFHFGSFGDDNLYPAPIAREVRNLATKGSEHITVYFPALGKKEIAWLVRELRKVPERRFELFSSIIVKERRIGNVVVVPKDSERFALSLSKARGLLTSAGFMAPSEALYRGINVCVVPQWSQFEQWWNAAGAQQCGATVIWKRLENASEQIHSWAHSLLDEAKPKVLTYENDGQRLRIILSKYL
jgi:hypothetical protein